jgi:hypothetical protein
MPRGPKTWHTSDMTDLQLVVSWKATSTFIPSDITGPAEYDEEREIEAVMIDGRVLTTEAIDMIRPILMPIIEQQDITFPEKPDEEEACRTDQ